MLFIALILSLLEAEEERKGLEPEQREAFVILINNLRDDVT